MNISSEMFVSVRGACLRGGGERVKVHGLSLLTSVDGNLIVCKAVLIMQCRLQNAQPQKYYVTIRCIALSWFGTSLLDVLHCHGLGSIP